LISGLGFTASFNATENGYAKVSFYCSSIGHDYPPPSSSQSAITVKYIGEGDYYGFEISGNKRFLLPDFTVVHNTTLIRSVMYEKSHIFPVAQIYSGTEDSNHFYESFIPNIFIFNKYERDCYSEFMKRQRIAKKYVENPWAIVLWDDCTEDPRIFNDPLIFDTYKNGRHRNMLHILSLQYCMDIKPSIRTNIDGTFILRESIRRNRENLWKNYCGCVPDFDDFQDILDGLTDNYTALYINNRVQSNKMEDVLFYYSARMDIPANWKFGAQEYHDFHNARYDTSYTDPVY